MIKTMRTCGELSERKTSLKVNFSSDLNAGRSKARRRSMMLRNTQIGVSPELGRD